MGSPAVGQDAQVVGVDIHIVLVPTPAGSVPTPLPHPFVAKVSGATVSTVKIAGKPAATKDSTTENSPKHIAMPPGVSFQSPPSDAGTVDQASSTVKVGGKGLARVGDLVTTCNDPSDQTTGAIIGPVGTVMAG
ncbi:MAG: PAAR domain-containing protein [Cellulomonas sp.]|uniref:PAAR motif protein n=1 Tax=Cellulomonas gelida TaxID=1712 RepID=A0A4Y3KN43_9CELL|nr:MULTISPECIES: PAAR domain-containing protein [Cellulomonas]KMM46511.1 PAAR motif protein [Cellulomonas sp. A375-1]MCR6647735.1 PAAR domain-containing protein [Cellulomonas sp.]MCR6703725.1 PAAR domain-containing protein [Cellulomonas sp.]GEA84380.1 PAAR motif protein [Cellulomonas gelida]GGL26243.1 PAAR motif protein [Cellulomonas gelida]